ncbi:MAG: restriction endonuclease [Syntrophaceae bacterium]|nr:restriction endonuclease [Syntrophaceae bacterium]
MEGAIFTIFIIALAILGFRWLVKKNEEIDRQNKAIALAKINKEKEEQRQRERQNQIAKDQAAKAETEEQERNKDLFKRNKDLIDKFLQIAERKISIIDEYGDENWEVLPSEILTCLKKIAQREKKDINLKKDDFWWPKQYKWLKQELEISFRSYHAKQKNNSTKNDNLSEMSGTEFESWVVKILKENGFDDVRGTPTTGDQGADIIAYKGERHIVIQAKRHKGSVGNKAVQEVIGALQYYGGNEGWVITNSTFTQSAIALAQKSNIRLIDGRALKYIEDFVF